MRDEKDSKLLNVLVSCGVFFIAACLLFTFMSSTTRTIEILSVYDDEPAEKLQDQRKHMLHLLN